MHTENLSRWQHPHNFMSLHEHGSRRSWQVLILTLIVMVIEIVAGMLFGSMALLADGWHMSTHAVAFIIVLTAYHYARKHVDNPAFSFGTGKISVLGGFASAVALAVVALTMFAESVARAVSPQAIQFNEALGVAVLGLAVNIASVFLLKTPHGHTHGDGEHHHHHDHNLKAAYLHVLADALTSVLAIVALLLGKYFGWNRIDAFAGMVGGVVIAHWAYGLLKETAPILLDGSVNAEISRNVRELIEAGDETRITDLHIWKVGPEAYAAIISLVTHSARTPEYYKQQLAGIGHLDHITVEINSCTDADGSV
jgi:cation diffusion facilitator family transporter